MASNDRYSTSLILFARLNRRVDTIVNHCHNASSVRPSGVNFYTSYFFSETTERTFTKLYREQVPNVLYLFYLFRPDRVRCGSRTGQSRWQEVLLFANLLPNQTVDWKKNLLHCTSEWSAKTFLFFCIIFLCLFGLCHFKTFSCNLYGYLHRQESKLHAYKATLLMIKFLELWRF